MRGDLPIEGVSAMRRHLVGKLVIAPGYVSTMGIHNVNVTVRTTRTAQDLAPSLRAVIHEVSPVVPARDIRPMDEVVAASIGGPRFETRLLAIFAALAAMRPPLTLGAPGATLAAPS